MKDDVSVPDAVFYKNEYSIILSNDSNNIVSQRTKETEERKRKKYMKAKKKRNRTETGSFASKKNVS
jgi:hypothetical protein